jgi:tRNA (cytidine/uridine-2'-O-)-methyltransferase
MDYLDHLRLQKHVNWDAFCTTYKTRRIVLLTTKADTSFLDFSFREADILLAGRESAGVPDAVHDYCTARVTVPMAKNTRSLNVAIAASLVLGEALRQTNTYP